MKIRKRELAKPGVYGTVDNPTVVTEKALKEIAETFPEIKKAPISLNGHWPDASKPRMGNVVSLSFDETTSILSGEVEEQDALADAVDKGFYPDVSIGSRQRASDGKMYLHHLAYLGEEPPAIKDLINSIQDSFDSDDPAEIAASDEAKTCVMFPSPLSKQLILSDPAATNPAEQGKEIKEKPSMKTAEELQVELDAEKKITAELKDKLKALSEKYPDAGIELSDGADPRVGLLTSQLRNDKIDAVLKSAEGRIPKAKHGLVRSIASQLSVGKNIELSDSNGVKTMASGLDVLDQLIGSIAAPVEAGRIELTDAAGRTRAVDFSKA